MKTRVLIVDDHAVFRSGVRALLSKEPDLEVVAEAGDGHATLRCLTTHDVDVLLLDLSLPGGMSGAQVAQAALEADPHLAIVVLTMHEDEYYLRETFKLGVRGYVLKNSEAADVIRAIRAAASGTHFVDPALAGAMVGTYVGRPAAAALASKHALTQRELEVCRLLAMGYTNGEVGEQLSISQRTVETHRAKIMSKLELTSRAELVRFAIDRGLLKT